MVGAWSVAVVTGRPRNDRRRAGEGTHIISSEISHLSRPLLIVMAKVLPQTRQAEYQDFLGVNDDLVNQQNSQEPRIHTEYRSIQPMCTEG